MKRFVCIAVLITALMVALVPGAFAQTTNSKYEVINFGAPFPTPTGKDRDTASVASDGKGLIFVLRRSEPPVLVYNREGKLVDSWGRDFSSTTITSMWIVSDLFGSVTGTARSSTNSRKTESRSCRLARRASKATTLRNTPLTERATFSLRQMEMFILPMVT